MAISKPSSFTSAGTQAMAAQLRAIGIVPTPYTWDIPSTLSTPSPLRPVRSLSRHPKVHPALKEDLAAELVALANSPDAIDRYYAAAHEDLPEPMLRMLQNDSDPMVRELVARLIERLDRNG